MKYGDQRCAIIEKEAQEIISKIKAHFRREANLHLGLQPWRYAFPCMLLKRPCQFKYDFTRPDANSETLLQDVLYG